MTVSFSANYKTGIKKATLFLKKAIEAEKLIDVSNYVKYIYESLCDDNKQPFKGFEDVARRVKTVSLHFSKLVKKDDSKLEYVWFQALGKDFGKDPTNFYLTPDEKIIWAKHKHVDEKGKEFFVKIPYNHLFFDVDNLIDNMKFALKQNELNKPIYDRRADQGSRSDVGAFLAVMASERSKSFSSYCKPALEYQMDVRNKAIQEMKTIIETIAIDLEVAKDGMTIRSMDEEKVSKEKFPRIEKLLISIANLEPDLRSFIRQNIILAFGNDWIDKMRQTHKDLFRKWEKVAEKRKGKDFLDGMQFGDLINMTKQYKELNDYFPDKNAVNLAFNEVLKQRPLLSHPLMSFKEDITEEKFDTITLAIKIIRRNISSQN